MIQRKSAADVLVCREAYGILQSIATRPVSRGNDGAMLTAVNDLRDINSRLANAGSSVLGPQELETVRSVIGQLGLLPPTMIARTLLGTLESALGRIRGADSRYALSFHRSVTQDSALDGLIVQVGPTIGVGDEALLARAFAEQSSARSPGLELAVSTRRPDLWSCVVRQVKLTLLEKPPLGALHFLASRPPEVRSRLGCVFLDFLRSDPVPTLLAGFPEVRFSARWFMGAIEGQMADTARNRTHALRYPWGMPASRWLESRWVAAQILTGATASSPQGETMWPEPVVRSGPIAFQALTSKPRLMLPPALYRDVFSRVRGALGDAFALDVISAPTAQGQELLQDICASVRRSVGASSVHTGVPERMDEVYERIRRATLLFGPDTFSSHLAAHAGVPQVCISLPEHAAWLSLGSPCLAVLPSDALVTACANRITALWMVAAGRGPTELSRMGATWRGALRDVDGELLSFLRAGRFDLKVIGAAVRRVQALYSASVETTAHCLGARYADGVPAFCEFDPESYDDEKDALYAAARWYHSIGLTDVSALLCAAPATAAEPRSSAGGAS